MDSLQQKYQCQWRRGCWLTKDEADHDIVAVGPREVLRSKAVRKIAEHWDGGFLISLEIGPWDLKRGVQTVVQQVKPAEQPLPRLHVSPDGVEADLDEEAVKKYAREHPDEDKEDVQAGGALQQPEQPHELQAVEERAPEMSDAEMKEAIAEAEKRDREFQTTLPIPVRQRVADVEGAKRSPEGEKAGHAKFVKFDHTTTEEKKAKQARTSPEMFSPTFAGDLVPSPGAASSSPGGGHVRRGVEDIELYDEDEVDEPIPLESWDWDTNDQLLEENFSQHHVSDEEKIRRGFRNEEAGPPETTPEELAQLDKQAMYTELDRLRQLDVIADVEEGMDVSEALLLDTKLVRDWRFRNGQWVRRARMVAREFRGQCASTDETFSPTTPLMLVKVLMVIALVKKLMVSALDVSDAFLQVVQRENVIVAVPNWVRVASENIKLKYWQLKKCLPGQRNAATR